MIVIEIEIKHVLAEIIISSEIMELIATRPHGKSNSYRLLGKEHEHGLIPCLCACISVVLIMVVLFASRAGLYASSFSSWNWHVRKLVYL